MTYDSIPLRGGVAGEAGLAASSSRIYRRIVVYPISATVLVDWCRLEEFE
jgi:hypothetical protein